MKPRILIVDDDPSIVASLSERFQARGYQVTTAGSGEEALATLKEGVEPVVVLILSDINMPGMSGLELQEKLSDLNSSLPIIFITGHGDIPMAVRAMQRGAVDFIQKVQRLFQSRIIAAALKSDKPFQPPLPMRLLSRIPFFRRKFAQVLAYGLKPELLDDELI